MFDPTLPFLRGSRPVLMGIINVTPDSFSDGGKFYNKNKAIECGLRLLDEGADLVDIGGESTRPGAEVIDIQEEIDRIVPVIEGLRGHARWISVDTRNASTMRAALDVGANIVNDISALQHDPDSLSVVADAKVPVVIMHMQGTPQDMQKKPFYTNVVDDVFSFFKSRIEVCRTNGIENKNIILDPGIGFGKTLEHNLLLLRYIKNFSALGCPVMLGTSRKSFIDKISPGVDAMNRLPGSLASVLWGWSQGVRLFRVHDVLETRQALDVFTACRQGGLDYDAAFLESVKSG